MKRKQLTCLGLTVFIVGCGAIKAYGEDSLIGSSWYARHLDEWPIFSLLIKSGGYGSGIPEPSQWESERPLKDPDREPALRKLLEEYPDTEYADDAALLLARAKLFYYNDPNSAIEALYKVIQDYPNGNWIAENEQWLLEIPDMLLKDKDGKWRPYATKVEDIPDRTKSSPYLNYYEQAPNKTADEARYWIAMTILSTDLKNTRYNEAIQIMEGVIQKYRSNRRVVEDLTKIETEPFNVIPKRTEFKCHLLLLKVYREGKKYLDLASTAEDFISLYEGHPACLEAHRNAGEAYEALERWDKAAFHYEAYVNHPKVSSRRKAQYMQKLTEVKNK